MKDFNEFLAEYSQSEEFKNRLTDAAAGRLSPEQLSAVWALLLTVLREYHQWSHE